MKKLFWALPLLTLASCGPAGTDGVPEKDVLMRTDIDELAGWLTDPTGLTKEKAHSGKYSLFVNADREFSLNYISGLGQLSATRLRGVRVEAWVFVPNKDATAKLEVGIKDAAGKDIFHDQTLLGQVPEYDKWVKVSKDIILPPAANFNSQIIIYTSRSGATSPVYLDDFTLYALR